MNDDIRAAQNGDHDAFEQLMLPRAGGMFAVAMLSLRDRALAEDAVQEALIRAWRSLPSLRRPDRFDAWLRKLLINSCVDVARATRRHRNLVVLPSDTASSTDIEKTAEERDAIERAFAELSVEHRIVFVLRHLESRNLPEIASACGIPLGTAKSRLHYAERAMARSIALANAEATFGEPA